VIDQDTRELFIDALPAGHVDDRPEDKFE